MSSDASSVTASADTPDAKPRRYTGRSLERVEDPALLRGRGRYADDLPRAPGTLHAAFLRSPHAHAEILSVDTQDALALAGVAAIYTGEDLGREAPPFITGVKANAPQFPLARDKVRYAGEPVAVVLADDRYLAEDALELIEVHYQALPVVVSARVAARTDAPRLHDGEHSNVLHEREFRYGDPQEAFANAHHVETMATHYPRNACTPVECAVVSAAWIPGAGDDDGAYEVTANFQGPYTLHTVMARSLGVAGNRLRLRTPPDSGGSFGVKQSVFPYVVALGLAARRSGRPVHWVEDRLEHLSAATSATSRDTVLKGAFDASGKLLALDFDQLEDCGAYLRAPEPATLYRMHGNMTGAYDVAHLQIRNRVVVTNRTPTGLNRGFGGPQIYFPLERLMDNAALALGIDRFEIRRRNLVSAKAMPYRTAPGALLDSGDYPATMQRAIDEGGLAELLTRQQQARAEGKLYGIGCAAVVEPSVSNMGYITTLLSPEARARSGPKNGALATATVSVDPGGSVSAHAASVPQGQGHRTVLAQVVADALGLTPAEIVVTMDHDSAKDAWSIASGNYSSRFAGVVAGAAHLAATRLRERIAAIAAADLNVAADSLVFADGFIHACGNPDNRAPFARTAAKAHWSPLSVPEAASEGLRETATWTMPELTEPDEVDRVNSSGCHGFIFDFCGVQIDPDSGVLTIDRYVTMHDAGTLLNPALANGQIRGGFAHGLGAALLEELAYDRDGSFLSGTLADYLPPTACEMPELTILHDAHPSPFTPLGAKGLGEGNCMSTPVCLANAIADATGHDVRSLPLTRNKVSELVFGEQAQVTQAAADPTGSHGSGTRMRGRDSTRINASRGAVWDALTDTHTLARVLPGCKALTPEAEPGAFATVLVLGVGPVKGTFKVRLALAPKSEGAHLVFSGQASGPLGESQGSVDIRLAEHDGVTTLDYEYDVGMSGKVASIGARMLNAATRVLTGQLIDALVRECGDGAAAPVSAPRRWLARLRGER